MARRQARPNGDAPSQDRRGANRIRGPQSALTDFLAANNISAAEITRQHAQRIQDAANDPQNVAESSTDAAARQDQEAQDIAEAVVAAADAAEKTRRRKRSEEDAIDKIKAKKKSSKKTKRGGDDYSDNGDGPLSRYTKSKPLPGQFENCDICEKRFTVTAYSKTGPNGGLLCTPCGKSAAKDAKDSLRASQPKKAGRKRRQMESNRLDGLAPNRAKSLQQLCIEKIVESHDMLNELGDLPPRIMERISEIFSKRRVLNSKTLKLFMRPDVDFICINDAAYLEVDDYMQLFGTNSKTKKIVIRNACQLKDEPLNYMLEKCPEVSYLQLYAANLVSDDTWRRVFETYGTRLQTLKLQWLDATFGDELVQDLVRSCPNLTRLKFKLCRRLGQGALDAIANLSNLQHLSLRIGRPVEPENVVNMIRRVGAGLRSLTLECMDELNDDVICAIKETCHQMVKLRISENDLVSDDAFTDLFTHWHNPALFFVDLNSTRDVDNNNPSGPEEQPIGLASNGFKALMAHSGPRLQTLDIASCRHVPLSTFADVFNGATTYPCLEYVNLSFCSCVNTMIVAGIFKSCPALKKLIAFGCFDILDVVVPRGVVLIGVPRAQDAIEQVGAGVGVDEAVTKMIESV